MGIIEPIDDELPALPMAQLSRSYFQPRKERVNTFIGTLYGERLTMGGGDDHAPLPSAFGEPPHTAE